MKIVLEHYVELLFIKNSMEVREQRKIKDRTSKLPLSKEVVGYKFFDRDVVTVKSHKVYGKPKNTTGWVYFGKEILAKDGTKQVEIHPNIFILGVRDRVIKRHV